MHLSQVHWKSKRKKTVREDEREVESKKQRKKGKWVRVGGVITRGRIHSLSKMKLSNYLP